MEEGAYVNLGVKAFAFTEAASLHRSGGTTALGDFSAKLGQERTAAAGVSATDSSASPKSSGVSVSKRQSIGSAGVSEAFRGVGVSARLMCDASGESSKLFPSDSSDSPGELAIAPVAFLAFLLHTNGHLLACPPGGPRLLHGGREGTGVERSSTVA